MSEEKVFKILQGIPKEEAEGLITEAYAELVAEANGNAAVSIQKLKERANEKLRPYGWSFDSLFNLDNATYS